MSSGVDGIVGTFPRNGLIGNSTSFPRILSIGSLIRLNGAEKSRWTLWLPPPLLTGASKFKAVHGWKRNTKKLLSHHKSPVGDAENNFLLPLSSFLSQIAEVKWRFLMQITSSSGVCENAMVAAASLKPIESSCFPRPENKSPFKQEKLSISRETSQTTVSSSYARSETLKALRCWIIHVSVARILSEENRNLNIKCEMNSSVDIFES